MITPPPGVQVYLACGYTDMRKGMATLAMLVQQTLGHDPFSGAIYAFRGRRGGLIKVLWHDGVGMCLFITSARRTARVPVADPNILQQMLREAVPELQAENEKLWQLIQRL